MPFPLSLQQLGINKEEDTIGETGILAGLRSEATRYSQLETRRSNSLGRYWSTSQWAPEDKTACHAESTQNARRRHRPCCRRGHVTVAGVLSP